MSTFQFKHFSIRQANSSLKVGTDAMLLGAFIDVENKKRGLDIGTGTGVLALMQAQKNSDLNIVALEIDSASCLDANENFASSDYRAQLELKEENILSFSDDQGFDLIFSNPPYYENTLKGVSAEVNLAKHVDDLIPEKLLQKVGDLLIDNGDFWVIWPYKTSQDFSQTANKKGLFLHREVTVFGKPNMPVRKVLNFKNRITEFPIYDTFIIRSIEGTYTKAYKNLTFDFHAKTL